MGLFGGLFGHRSRAPQAPTPATIETRPTRNPEQEAAMMEAIHLAMSHLKDPLQGFEPISQRARSQFQTQTIPSLAERFTAMGGGAQHSSGFEQALGKSGSELEEMLAALGSQYGLQSVGQYSNLLGLGLQPTKENMVLPGTGGMPGYGGSPGLFGGMLQMGGLGLLRHAIPSLRRF